MKTIGIIGGIGPESTIEYYRFIIESYRERVQDGSYPSVIINSIDLQKMVAFFEATELDAATRYLVNELHRLAQAGAQIGLLAANTPHLVFEDVRRQSPIPLVSIVEATCEAARALGLKRLALFGTRFTMQGRFYPDVFSTAGIQLILPAGAEQAYIHDKYMNELLKNIFLPATRRQLLAIIERLKERDHIDGLILGGTELPLILRDVPNSSIPFLDTTRIHVNSIVAQSLS